MKTYYSIIALFLIVVPCILAQDEWPVPVDKEQQLSPFPFTQENIEIGRKLYEANCLSCHGNPGKGNYITTLDPMPSDPVSARIQRNSDGAIFFKLTEGKGAMPSFKNILGSTDLWNLIAYLRSFNPEYAQKVAEKIVEGSFGAKDLKILLSYLQDEGAIKAVVAGTKDGVPVAVAGAELNLFAVRQFGNMLIDEAKRTNNNGEALFEAPKSLPGDSLGQVRFVAKLYNETLYGTVRADTVLHAGVPTLPVSLRAQRAMWNTVWRAPIWLLIAYFGTVIVVWSFILFILLQIRSIFLLGKQDIKNN